MRTYSGRIIGGPKAGEYLAYEGTHYRAVVYETVTPFSWSFQDYDKTISARPSPIKYFLYRYSEFQTAFGNVGLWVPQERNDKEVLEELLRDYQGRSETYIQVEPSPEPEPDRIVKAILQKLLSLIEGLEGGADVRKVQLLAEAYRQKTEPQDSEGTLEL